MKRRGRPRVDDSDESVVVSLTLPARHYDEIYRRARVDGTTVSARIRRELQCVRDARERRKRES